MLYGQVKVGLTHSVSFTNCPLESPTVYYICKGNFINAFDAQQLWNLTGPLKR